MERSEQELKVIDSAIVIKRSEIGYFTALLEFSKDAVDTMNNEENIARLFDEIAYLEALKDGPVILFASDSWKGFPDIETALAYLDAERIAAGKPAGGTILAVGPESKKAIEKLMDEEGGHA